MKKNFITLLTFALVLVNLVLTAIMALAIVPSTKQANELIQKVSTAIDLDLASGDAQSTGNYDISQIQAFNFSDTFTVPMKVGEDGKQHYVVLSVTLSLNKDNKDYTDNEKALKDNETVIRDEVNGVLQSFTLDEFNADQQAVKQAVLQRLKDLFPGDFIVSVGFPSVTVQ